MPTTKPIKRADIPSLGVLLDMYESGTEYIALENDPEDAPERDQMVAILDLIEDLIPVEANEDMANRARAAVRGGQPVEMRFAVAPITHVDVRDTSANDDNTWTMSGYAAVFNQAVTLYDSKYVRLTESIDPGFFNNVLRDQPMGAPDGVVHFNFGHDMNRAVAATDVPAGQPGSLQLSVDKEGLRFLAKVSRDDPDGVALASKLRNGVVKQASFAFTIAAANYVTTENDDGPDEEHRTLLDCKHLYDVCATAQGAYPQTVANLRSIAAALGQPHEWGGHARQPVEGGVIDVSRSGGVVGQETPGADALLAHRIKHLQTLRGHFNGKRD